MKTTDYYDLLGIKPDASDAEIRRAFRACAKKFHPDLNSGNIGYAARMKEIIAAYEVLKDPLKRKDYDRSRAKLHNSSGDEKVRPSTPKSRPQTHSSDIYLNIRITLENAFSGVSGKFTYSRFRRCNSCRGSGNLFGRTCAKCNGKGFKSETVRLQKHIPFGVVNGQRLRFPGYGNEGWKRDCFGTLHLIVNILPHACFTRDGDHLIHIRTVPETVLKNGAKICIRAIDGKTVRLSIPEKTQSGTIFRLRHLGMTNAFTGNRGDLLVQLISSPPDPSKKSEAQKKQGVRIRIEPDGRILFNCEL